eukprot:GHVU01105746.1.p1 GENE.GHVU01105746.1~~GHVU01105746.1.p1  ORF type:complete len:214 (-),score=51.22 GHVU01105746.1:253-894(-)
MPLEGKTGADREEWMTVAPKSLAKAFGQSSGEPVEKPLTMREKRKREEEQQRMRKEVEEYDRKYRPTSLMDISADADFREEAAKSYKKFKVALDYQSDRWGKSNPGEGTRAGDPMANYSSSSSSRRGEKVSFLDVLGGDDDPMPRAKKPASGGSKAPSGGGGDKDGDPWVRFDRDEMMKCTNKVKAKDFQNLLTKSKDMGGRFSQGQYSSSHL